MKKQYSVLPYIIFIILYLEFFTKIIIFKNCHNLEYILLFSIPYIFIIYILCNIFKNKGNKIFTYLITFILCFYYSFQTIFYKLFIPFFLLIL